MAADTELRANLREDIEFPNFAVGDYEFEVFPTGFAAMPKPVTVVKGPISCDLPVVISMNVIGSGCAPATSGKGN
jgi:hypothetical protein